MWKPGTPPGPEEEVGVAAVEVCLGPCASLRQMRVGTRAQGPGLWFHAVVHHPLRRKGSLAVGSESGWE